MTQLIGAILLITAIPIAIWITSQSPSLVAVVTLQFIERPLRGAVFILGGLLIVAISATQSTGLNEAHGER